MRGIFVFALAIMFPLAAYSWQSKHLLTNEDITKLAKGGFADEVIVALIESSDTDFDVTIGGLTALKQDGVSSKVMEAMLKAQARKRQGSTDPATSKPAGTAQPNSPPPTVPNPAMSMMGGNGIGQMLASIMAMNGMGGATPGTLDMSQLPALSWIVSDEQRYMKPSIAQIAQTNSKGSMPGTGSGAMSALMGLGSQALSFAAISGGGMFAGPAAGMAMSAVSGFGGLRHHGPPNVTYVWALPGAQSSLVAPSAKPRFEMLFGNLLGIDPDAYQPFLIRLVNSKDNWRLVGATKSIMGQMSTEAYEKVTEVRVPVKSERLGRGQVQIEPKDPLPAAEYAVVLRALHPGKRSKGSLGGGAEQTVFFSVWDFSVRRSQ